MPRFFIENVSGDAITITGQDAAHIAKSLRMKENPAVMRVLRPTESEQTD